MSVAGFTPLIELEFPVAIDLNLATELIIHVILGSSVVLKFKLGGGAGYDGDITINLTEPNKCTCVGTPAQAAVIKVGKMKAEFKLSIPFTGYPSGRVVRGIAELINITTPNTIQ